MKKMAIRLKALPLLRFFRDSKFSSPKMKKTYWFMAISCIWLPSQSVLAEDVTVPLGQQNMSVDRSSLPKAGMTKDQVYGSHGSALRERPAVGEPPISRWLFKDFTVYFEYEHVVHVVVHANVS